MGVPVKPMYVPSGSAPMRKLPRSPPLVRCASSAKAAEPPANEDATKKDDAPTEEVRPTG